MLQVGYLRQNREEVIKRLAVKHFTNTNLIDEVIALDDQIRKEKVDTETMQSRINAASREVGRLMAEKKKEEAEAIRAEVAELKKVVGEGNSRLTGLEARVEELLVLIPNLPHPSVPPGKNPEDNEILRTGGSMPELAADAKPHWELIKDFDIIDFETGARITGSGFPLYKGQGAKLQRALIQLFLDFNTAAGYLEITPPLMVNEETAYGTGQLPDKEGQMYNVTLDKFYLIPTSEVPVTNVYARQIVKEEQLPIKMTSYTPCFRREAGSFGSEVRGLNRLHQFDKVEIVQLTHPDISYEAHQDMVSHVEKLLTLLELPYRILRLCGGDMSFTSALTYDFEVWSAAQKKWLEVSSVSNFETYQTNRMKIRFKDADGKMKLVHSLNGSSLALPRIVAALLENNQAGNKIMIPTALQPYFGKESIEKV